MFDDLNKTSNQFSSNQSIKPIANNGNYSSNPGQSNMPSQPRAADDMFAETDPVKEKPQVFQPKDYSAAPEGTSSMVSGHNFQKIFLLIFMFLGLILVGWGGYVAYNKYSKSQIEIVEEKTNNNEQNNQENTQVNNEQPKEEAVMADQDKDGISDEEEASLGLDSTTVDTDNDGLFDREEVKVYRTDPLNPDTDGDGISDGDEVRNGTDPKGPGALFKIGTESNEPIDNNQPPTENKPVTESESTIVNTENNNTTTVQTGENQINIQDLDSDSDGLNDNVEIEVYATDPLNPDTDGDGYKDGDEVKNGYNPKGDGKLSL